MVAEIFSVLKQLLVGGVPSSASETILEIQVTLTKSLKCGHWVWTVPNKYFTINPLVPAGPDLVQ